MKLSAIQIGTRSRRAMTGIESLAASIEKVGLLHPPAVREAADGLAEGDENVEREPFTPAEAVAHAARIREVEAARRRNPPLIPLTAPR